MPDRASLVRLGRLVMADVAAGRPGANSEMASRLLQKQPEAALELIDMLLAKRASRGGMSISSRLSRS